MCNHVEHFEIKSELRLYHSPVQFISKRGRPITIQQQFNSWYISILKKLKTIQQVHVHSEYAGSSTSNTKFTDILEGSKKLLDQVFHHTKHEH